ncbi:MAG TPA: glutamine--fructose-6-phosphate transaminase (isomerizing) [Candidatus Hydrothermia bacterium]|nr:glutamine--fructose-6-phosphate transaminase (isomerizing) [Candidatus Hydrothermia bacterium]
MCGIVGYIGSKDLGAVILVGLEKLEYRGYDSAGIAVIHNGRLVVKKRSGRIGDLYKLVNGMAFNGKAGIGHTRWATHGGVNDINAHPHVDCKSQIAVSHNGIIENFQELKLELEKSGHKFVSETDSEVIPHLIEEYYEGSLFDAVLKAVKRLQGSFALVILSSMESDRIIGVKMGSPLIIGVGKDEMLLSSDQMPLLSHTKDVVVLNDGEICVLTQNSWSVYDFDGNPKQKYITKIDWTVDMAEKGEFSHFMLKEIFEQPEVLRRNLEYYIRGNEVTLLKDFNLRRLLLNKDRILIQASGTSMHAGLVGKYLLEKLARIQTDVDYSSEFRYREPVLGQNTLVIAISQSGETADTLAGVKLVKENGFEVLSIVNVKDSSIARESDYVLYINAGPEIGVASTKAYTAQILILFLLSLEVGLLRGFVSEEDFSRMRDELFELPGKINDVLCESGYVKEVAARFLDAKHFVFLGRGINYPTALEGALKLKEVSYVHATGYAAGEMKHGPLALVDKDLPVVFVNPKTSVYEKSLNNIEEVRARGGIIISVASSGDLKMEMLSDYVFKMPEVNELLTPLVSIIPLQLFAYNVAVGRGCDVDRPRNLAKSVTVE